MKHPRPASLHVTKQSLFLAFCLLFLTQIGVQAVSAQPDSDARQTSEKAIATEVDPEIKAIAATLQDYIQGSTNGQPALLGKAFHRSLNLYSIKDRKLSVWSGSDYIADTKKGQPTGETGEVISIDYENDIAMAKVKIVPPRGRPFVDYFMLLKIDDHWTIVHKSYTRRTGNSGSVNFATGTKTSKLPKRNSPSPNEDTESNRKIDKILAKHDRLDEPGVAVAVVQNGKVIYQRAVGAANIEHQSPIVTGKTLFNIGSTSKHFTGFAIATLVEQGKVALDDDIRKYVPELPDLGQKITLRHLANHTSGIRSELSLLAMAGWSPGDVIRKRHVLNILKRQQALNFPPGEQFEYSNSGFTLLAEVVLRVSGKGFHQFCRDEMFAPLGMSNSYFSTGQTELRPDMAYSYGADEAGFFPRFPNSECPGATELWTTCEDMATWATNFQTREHGSTALWTNMLTPGALSNGLSSDYSLGLFIKKHKGHKHIHHGGATSSYRAFLGYFPDANLTVVLMTNSQQVNAQQTSLKIADLFLEGNDAASVDAKSKSTATLTREQLEHYTGRYWNRKDRSASVFIEDDSLVYSIDGGPSLPMSPVSETEFQLVGVDSGNLKFEKREAGDFSIAIPHSDGRINRLEPYTPVEPTNEQLQAYVGRYFCAELDTSYTIRLDQGRLKVDHVRFQGIELIPIVADSFRNSSWRFTTMQFERDEDGDVKGFQTHSLRNRNLAFIRMADATTELGAKKTRELSFDGMDAVAEEMRQEQRIPGLAVVVTSNGRTVFKKGYGLANVEKNTPVDPDKTLFRIGSVSKALTFLALTRLIDQGKLKRTDRVDQFISNIANPRNFESPVTIDHLLMHTGGFDQIGTGRHIFDHYLSLEHRKAKRVGLVEFLEANNLRRVSDAGEMFRYDTYGVTLAGAIIEKVTGKSFADAMKQEMFDPLGMARSFVESDEDHFADLAIGYGWEQNQFSPRPYEVYVTTPASSIDMTPCDMGLLMEALTNRGSNRHGRLFSEGFNAKVLSKQFQTRAGFPGITHGFFESFTSKESTSGVHLRTVGHGGSMDGYRCALTMVPKKNVGVFVIANRAPESGGGPIDFRPLLDLVINQFDDSPRFEKFEIPEPTSIDEGLQERLSEYAAEYFYGVYCHTATRDDVGAGAWRRRTVRPVEVREHGLFIGKEMYLPFRPDEKDVFVKSDGERLVHFGRNSDGVVTHFVYSTSPDTFEREMPDLPYRQIRSLAQELLDVAAADSSKSAIELLNDKLDSESYYINEREFNRAGYQFLEQKDFKLAIRVFKTNTRRFPQSWNAYDSLAEGYAMIGKPELAIENYRKAVELNPHNHAGKLRLKVLLEEK